MRPIVRRVSRQKIAGRLRCVLGRLLFLAVSLGAASRCVADGGEGLYNKFCSMCHGVDGKGQTKIGVKLGAKDLSLSKLTDAELEKQIREGRSAEDGKLKMPAFKDSLTPDEMKALIAWVKAFRK